VPEDVQRVIIDGACVGACDAQRRILLWNRKAEELFGWTKAEARGKRFDDLLKVKLDLPAEEIFDVLLRDGHWRGEIIVRHKDGHEICLAADWQRASDERGNCIFLLWYTDATQLELARKAIESHSLTLQQLYSRLATALDDERARIAREFHDHVGQALTAAKLNLYQASATQQPPVMGQKLRKQLKQAISAMDAATKLTQTLCMELRPVMLDDVSLAEAIRWHAQQLKGWTGALLKLHVDSNVHLDREVSTALFRIFQESLTNVVRHSQAKEVRVSLVRSENYAQLIVRDNGRGMDLQKTSNSGSLGLLGMRERAAAVGGEVEIRSEPGGGTTVTARVPL
jgi:PAS domain S-box-containing protein